MFISNSNPVVAFTNSKFASALRVLSGTALTRPPAS
jgi:hypothetical protein